MVFLQVSQLIHTSKDFPNLDTASVTVHFSFIQDGEGEEFTVIEGSEFTIKRTAHDDNSSNYYLNGKRSGYKEITEKVMEVGIDLTTSRFLILQVRDAPFAPAAQLLLTELWFARVKSSRSR